MDLKICLSGSILEKCWCPFPVIVWFKHNKHALSLTEKCPFSLQTQLCWTLGLCWNRNLSLTSHVLSKQQDTSNEQKSEDIENWVIYAQCSGLTNILYNVVSEWAPLLLCVSLHHVLALAKGRGAVTGYSRTPLLNTSRFLIMLPPWQWTYTLLLSLWCTFWAVQDVFFFTSLCHNLKLKTATQVFSMYS